MAIASLEKKSNGELRFTGSSNIRDFEFIDKLGEGTFGEVYKARSKRTNTIVALKKILMHNEKDGFPITAIREIKILKILSHPNVLQLKEMAIERGKGEGRKKPSMYMVTPYMEHDLSGLLENSDALFTEPQIKCYMMQLLEGLRYLHASHILHRDMKTANLLISNGGILQIADFGLARPYDEEPPQPGKGGGEARREYTALVVTRWYRPPELLLSLRKYTTAIDLWGVGCVFGEMFKGKPIVSGRSDLEQLELIFNLVGSPTEDNMPGWSALPGCEGVKSFAYSRGNLSSSFKALGPLAISLLSELLKLDWRKRINAIDALKHPYFTTPPLPARPGEIPSYQDSHEFDRKKLRNQQKPFPPAPAGAATNASSSGGWTGSNSRVPNSGHSRIPGAARGGRSNNLPGPGNQNRRGTYPSSQNNGLPPRPPASAHQPWDGPPGRDRRDDQRRDQFSQNRQNGRFSSNVDSYVPHYGNANDRAQDAGDYNARNTDWRGSNRFDQRRDYHREPRRRSRSPSYREGKELSRDTSRGP